MWKVESGNAGLAAHRKRKQGLLASSPGLPRVNRLQASGLYGHVPRNKTTTIDVRRQTPSPRAERKQSRRMSQPTGNVNAPGSRPIPEPLTGGTGPEPWKYPSVSV